MSKELHILSGFEEALRKVRDDTLIMASYALRSFDNAMRGLLNRDMDLCKLTIADDEEIDDMEKRIDHDAVHTLIRFTPVAGDLRDIIAAMKISSNLERIGDQAVTLARRARNLNRHEPLNEVKHIIPIFDFTRKMLVDAIQFYSERDAAAARELIRTDKTLDDMCHEFDTLIGDTISTRPSDTHPLLDLLFVSRSLERIGDHAANIAEDIIFMQEARDVRHGVEKKN